MPAAMTQDKIPEVTFRYSFLIFNYSPPFPQKREMRVSRKNLPGIPERVRRRCPENRPYTGMQRLRGGSAKVSGLKKTSFNAGERSRQHRCI
jgi:hypothetical protein